MMNDEQRMSVSDYFDGGAKTSPAPQSQTKVAVTLAQVQTMVTMVVVLVRVLTEHFLRANKGTKII